MNGNAHIYEKWKGKTINDVTFSNEDFEDTWVQLKFTDGSEYKIASRARHADDNWLEVDIVREEEG